MMLTSLCEVTNGSVEGAISPCSFILTRFHPVKPEAFTFGFHISARSGVGAIDFRIEILDAGEGRVVDVDVESRSSFNCCCDLFLAGLLLESARFW